MSALAWPARLTFRAGAKELFLDLIFVGIAY